MFTTQHILSGTCACDYEQGGVKFAVVHKAHAVHSTGGLLLHRLRPALISL